jgi:hypothetical protein
MNPFDRNRPPETPVVIEAEIHRGKAPTLRELAREMVSLGVDRGALVRRPDGAMVEAALCVVLILKPAIVQIGPLLLEAADKVAGPGTPAPNWPGFASEATVPEIFRQMEADKLRWAAGTPDSRVPLMFTFFISQEVCEWLAPRLTALGCPTSLK